MNLVSSECIILRTQDLGENDKLVSFLTPEVGRIKGVVKGSRKLTSRGVGSFEPFSRGLIHYVPRQHGDLVTIRKCDPRPPYLYLRQDYHCYLYAGYLAELVDLCTIEAREAAPYFSLLAGTLDALCEDGPPRRLPLLRLRFELHHLELLGYAPDWRHCGQCGKALLRDSPRARESAVEAVHPAPHTFDTVMGGLRCPECAPQRPQGLTVSPEALVFLDNWRRGNSSGADSGADGGADGPGGGPGAGDPGDRTQQGATHVRPTRRVLEELEAAVTAHLIHHLEKRPRSLQMLPSLEELAALSGE